MTDGGSNILTNSISAFDETLRSHIAKLAAYYMNHGVSDQAAATHKAIVTIALKVPQQATIMTFSDTFFLWERRSSLHC